MKLPWVSRRVHEDVRRYLQREAERSDQIAAAYKEIAQERGARTRELEAKYDALLARVFQTVVVPIPQADGAMIPDPPSVTEADAKVAVALRDREAPPLKRALRPGEDE